MDKFVSEQTGVVEEIWVNVAEGAEKTGFHPDHVRRLARKNGRLPEDQRFIRIRKTPREYAIWLPDLMSYLNRKRLFLRTPSNHREVEEIWVNVTEGAGIMGYNRQYVMRLANKLWQLEEENRPVKMRRRTTGYELWLPDLVDYMETTGRGPYLKSSNK